MREIIPNLYISNAVEIERLVNNTVSINNDILIMLSKEQLLSEKALEIISNKHIMLHKFELEDGVSTRLNKTILFNCALHVARLYVDLHGDQLCETILRDSPLKGRRIIAFCGAGLSRTPAVVIGALMVMGRTYEEAYATLCKLYPQQQIDPVFTILLERWGLLVTTKC